ncbi:alpha/beta hydrolase [Sphingobacterium bovistauri]|uniref:Alpha/beta hydrolase n=1 Tax=Sphingobacterium bovistauri TaxID=2781959 RepID=A0ABS7Z205_9SPHI|nr:alpha/beta hydrolase [Sphingobacterium bovistauri]MCA5004192.1 alpha/beta hydrolase [Sphingobacterium bovistauri]
MINTIKMTMVCIGFTLNTFAFGQINQANPFGLVYQNAIKQNNEGAVQIHSVHYSLNGITIAANVYTPPGYDHAKKYAAIVIAHPNGGVKEQVSGLYAQHLANRGYITIVADAAYQGASGGQPRNVDKPANRIEDIHGMADFISKYPAVDADKIGLLGICGGGGYALKAAQGDKRFKSVATLSMFNSGRVRRNGFLDKDVATIQARLAKASQAREQEVLTGEISYLGTANPTDEEIRKIPTDLYREGYAYYYRTHAHPNSTFRYAESSLVDLMTFDANTNMDLINQPLLMIAGSKADTKYMSEEVFPNAINALQKELFVLEGATHIETYWKEEYVKQALDKLGSFYGITLN